MTIAVVQELTAGAWTGVNFGSNVTSGSTLEYAVSAYSTTGATINTTAATIGGSSPTNTAKLIDKLSGGTDNVYTALWQLPNVAGGSSSVAVTISGQSTPSDNHTVGITAVELSGMGTLPTVDKSNSATGSSTAVTTGATGNITSGPEFVFASMVIFGQTVALLTSPWTSTQLSDQFQQTSYQIPASSGSSYTASQTAGGSAEWCGAIVAIQPTASGAQESLLTACGIV